MLTEEEESPQALTSAQQELLSQIDQIKQSIERGGRLEGEALSEFAAEVQDETMVIGTLSWSQVRACIRAFVRVCVGDLAVCLCRPWSLAHYHGHWHRCCCECACISAVGVLLRLV